MKNNNSTESGPSPRYSRNLNIGLMLTTAFSGIFLEASLMSKPKAAELKDKFLLEALQKQTIQQQQPQLSVLANTNKNSHEVIKVNSSVKNDFEAANSQAEQETEKTLHGRHLAMLITGIVCALGAIGGAYLAIGYHREIPKQTLSPT